MGNTINLTHSMNKRVKKRKIGGPLGKFAKQHRTLFWIELVTQPVSSVLLLASHSIIGSPFAFKLHHPQPPQHACISTRDPHTSPRSPCTLPFSPFSLSINTLSPSSQKPCNRTQIKKRKKKKETLWNTIVFQWPRATSHLIQCRVSETTGHLGSPWQWGSTWWTKVLRFFSPWSLWSKWANMLVPSLCTATTWLARSRPIISSLASTRIFYSALFTILTTPKAVSLVILTLNNQL